MGRDCFGDTIFTTSEPVLNKKVQEKIESNESTDPYAGGWCGISTCRDVIPDKIFGSENEAREYIYEMYPDHTGEAVPVRVVKGEKDPKKREDKWNSEAKRLKKYEDAYKERQKKLEEARADARKGKISELRKLHDTFTQKKKDAEAKHTASMREHAKALQEYEKAVAASGTNTTTTAKVGGDGGDGGDEAKVDVEQKKKPMKPRAPVPPKVMAPGVKCTSGECPGVMPLYHVFSPESGGYGGYGYGYSSRYKPDSINNEKCPFCRANLVGTDTIKIKTLEEQTEKAKKALFEASDATPKNIFFYVHCVALC